MRTIVSTAERLRLVRRASRQFMVFWAIDQMTRPQPSNRRGRTGHTKDSAAIADPHNHDWSLLYRGNILDD